MSDDGAMGVVLLIVVIVGVLAALAVVSVPPEKAATCPVGQAAQNETKAGAFVCYTPAGTGGCPSSCVTSLNSLVNSITLGVFSSLNLTTSGNTLTLGINLAHSNIWSSTQQFQQIILGDGTTTGGLRSTNVAQNFFYFDSSNNWQPTISTTDGLGHITNRLTFGENAAQGSAGIISYEPFSPNVGNRLSLGTMTNFWAVLYVQAIQAGTGQDLQLGCNSGHSFQTEISGIALFNVNCSTGTSTFENGGEIQGIAMPFSVYHASGDANPTAQLGDTVLDFGAGGSNTLDTILQRTGVGSLQLGTIGNNAPTLTMLPAGTGIDSQLTLCASNSCAKALNFQDSNSLALIFAEGSIPLQFETGSVISFELSTTGIANTQGFQSVINQALSNGAAVTTINLPVTEPDTTYSVSCTPNGSTALGAWWVDTKAVGSFHFHTTNNAGAASTVDCIITHQ